MAEIRDLQGQRGGGGCFKKGRVRRKASRLWSIARAGIGQGVEPGGRKVWKKGKGLNGKKKKDPSGR